MPTYNHSIEVPVDKVDEKLTELKAEGLEAEVYGSGSIGGTPVKLVRWQDDNPEHPSS